MKLSMCTSSLCFHYDHGLDELTGLKALRASGFTVVDYDIRLFQLNEQLETHAADTRANLEACGLTAGQGHAPIIYDQSVSFEGRIDIFKRSLRFAQLAGIPQVVIHPNRSEANTREDFISANTAFYRALIPAAEETGVGVLIENVGKEGDPYFLATGADLRALIDSVDHPLFTACWDVGHGNLFWPENAASQYDSIVALGDKLTALHVHDNCGIFEGTRQAYRADMHMMPFGSVHSTISFDAVLMGLKDIGYQGTFNFECLFPGYKQWVDFSYKGESANRLKLLPLSLWQQFNAAVYSLGEYMLQTYDLFEA